MKLLELFYRDSNWELNNLQLEDVNLVVGKNSVGKTRTLHTISRLCDILLQKQSLPSSTKWHTKFVNSDKEIIQYEFSTNKEGQVFHEKISINSKLFLERDEKGNSEIKSQTSNEKDVFYPPFDKLVFHVRRDIRAYPYLEEIVNWASRAFRFDFASFSPTKIFDLKEKYRYSASHAFSVLFKDLSKIQKETVKNEFNLIGYNVINFSLEGKDSNIILKVKEKDIGKDISIAQISQGMFRALATVIYFESITTHNEPTTLIIDDLGEGLDYERATKLGKLIFEKCENSNIQLIATSNDNFLMDVVDIKHWNILQRQGKVVSALNYKTHKDLFEKFRFTGLSNFDFFASDYIKQKMDV